MSSRWFSLAINMLWLLSVTWLVTTKVLPPKSRDEPPTYRDILAQQGPEPVGWRMTFNGRQIGWALSMAEEIDDGVTEVRSTIHIDEAPIRQLTPGWIRTLFGLSDQHGEGIGMDAESLLTIDAFGRLAGFESKVRIHPLPDPIRLTGAVDGSRIRLTVRAGEERYVCYAYFPQDGLLGGAFLPQTELPDLRRGQRWKVPTYNPLRPSNPLDLLEAKVERMESFVWDNQTIDAWVVVLRPAPGHGIVHNDTVQGRLWVSPDDGKVLKQQINIFDKTITFVRLTSDELDLVEVGEALLPPIQKRAPENALQ